MGLNKRCKLDAEVGTLLEDIDKLEDEIVRDEYT
jgi:hypothetical protein